MIPPARHAAQHATGQLRRPAEGGGARPGDARVPRRHHQRRRRAQRELRARVPRAVHDGTRRRLHAGRRRRRVARVHRLGRRPSRDGPFSDRLAARRRAAVECGVRRRAVTTPASKTLLGTTGAVRHGRRARRDPRATRRPRTFVVTKLYRELVGLDPDDDTVESLAKGFRRDYEILPLVDAIVQHDAFTSDAAVRASTASPVEKLVGIVQAGGPAAPRRSGDGRGRQAGDRSGAARPCGR